jgi:hypothetical protein
MWMGMTLFVLYLFLMPSLCGTNRFHAKLLESNPRLSSFHTGSFVNCTAGLLDPNCRFGKARWDSALDPGECQSAKFRSAIRGDKPDDKLKEAQQEIANRSLFFAFELISRRKPFFEEEKAK